MGTGSRRDSTDPPGRSSSVMRSSSSLPELLTVEVMPSEPVWNMGPTRSVETDSLSDRRTEFDQPLTSSCKI
jgi:hypothetical protein